MKKIDTGFPLIHFYEGVLSSEDCKEIKNFIVDAKNIQENDESKMPWETSDTINLYSEFKNLNILNIIRNHRKILTKLISESFNEVLYPHFTDLVLWKTGRKMGTHIDNGDMHPQGSDLNKMFQPRHYSAVVYINDDYEGGNTLIFNEERNKVLYKSKPKEGAVLLFTSDGRCPHGVSQVIGTRVTLPTWFTKDINFKDNL